MASTATVNVKLDLDTSEAHRKLDEVEERVLRIKAETPPTAPTGPEQPTPSPSPPSPQPPTPGA